MDKTWKRAAIVTVFLGLVAGLIAATPNMTLDLPVVGTTVGPTWATKLNTALTAVDAHDHTSTKGVLVPSTGIGINATLEYNNNHLSELKSSRFQEQASPLATGSDIRSLYVSGGNLYYNNASGAQIQLTSGSTINQAAIGGFTGDYSSTGATALYTDATKLYTFRQPDLTNAHIQAANATFSGNETVAGTLGVTGATTLSSTANVVGNFSVNTNKFNVTAASGNTLVAGTLGVTGATTLSDMLGVTGNTTLTTVTASGTVAANGSITMANAAPSIAWGDTTATADDFYANADGNQWNMLIDTNDDGGFEVTAFTFNSTTSLFDITGSLQTSSIIRAREATPRFEWVDTTGSAYDFTGQVESNKWLLSYDPGSDGTFEGTALSYDGSTGRLGINNPSPAYTLDVTGNARFTTDVKTNNFFTSEEANPRLYLTDSTATEDDGILSMEANVLRVSFDTDDNGTFDTANVLTVSGANTSVGINTVTPTTFDLEVAGDIGPEVGDVRDIGRTGTRWRALWSLRGFFTGDNQTAASDSDLVARHARNANVLLGRWDSAGTLTGDHFNILSVVRTSLGFYTVTPDVAIDTDSVCFGNARTAGAVFVACSNLSTSVICKSYDPAGALVDEPLSVLCVGSPATLP